jgi:hypothetical protein
LREYTPVELTMAAACEQQATLGPPCGFGPMCTAPVATNTSAETANAAVNTQAMTLTMSGLPLVVADTGDPSASPTRYETVKRQQTAGKSR